MGEHTPDPDLLLPSLRLTLSPIFEDGVAKAISVTMILHEPNYYSPRFKAGTPMLTMWLAVGATPTARYDGRDDIRAWDDAGDIALTYRDRPETGYGPREWLPARDAMGDITVRFTAPCHETDASTPPRPRIDLRNDPAGGLVGMGAGFLPMPPPLDGDERDALVSHDRWKVEVCWDLAAAPAGTRSACSLGDGLGPLRAKGNLEKFVVNTFFAAGPLQRFPAWDSSPPTSSPGQGAGEERSFAMYWLGEPPFDMVALARQGRAFFNAVADYFLRSAAPYRIFVRKTMQAGHGACPGTASFLLEYSNGAEEELSPHTVAAMLSRGTVHQYALLEDPDDDDDDFDEIDWYGDGVACYVGAITGYTGGGWARHDMVQALNGYAQAYYTSPVVNLPLSDMAEHLDDVHAERAFYFRGAMYLAHVNGLIGTATGGEKGVDDIILELYRRRMGSEPYGTAQFRDQFATLAGREAADEAHAAMVEGRLIVPQADCLGKLGLRLVRRDAEKFQLGFDEGSMLAREVQGLIRGSRADLAGVREGDTIVRAFMVWCAADELDSMMQMTVDRDGEHETIRFWPRSHDKVECYVWVDADGEQAA